MRYAWIIDHDYLADGDDDETGVRGPYNAPDDLLEQLRQGEGAPFRMYDDDGELYYAGRYVAEDMISPDDLGNEAFGPLDDFGTPNAGCTEIRYRYRGKWTTL